LILDYKTDSRPAVTPETVQVGYLAQMAAYRAAIRVVFPGRRVKAALLWTEIPSLMDLPDDLLDKAAMRLTPDLAPAPEP